MFSICSGVCFLLSGTMLDAILSCGGSTVGVCTIGILWCNLPMVIGSHQVCTEWLLPLLIWAGGASCYSISCSSAIPTIWLGIQLWGIGREPSNPSAFPSWWGEVLFSRFYSIWWHSQLWICDGIKPGDSSVVIGYQVDEFTFTWSGEQFVAHSHIYSGFIGKVSSWTHLAWNQGIRIIPF